MRIAVDTNVLVSAIVFGGLPRSVLATAALGLVELVTGAEMLDELERVLVDKFAFSAAAARSTRTEIESLSVIVQPASISPVCRDPEDDRLLATALGGSAEAIVSGDRDVLDLDSFEGMRIMAPRDFLALLDEG